MRVHWNARNFVARFDTEVDVRYSADMNPACGRLVKKPEFEKILDARREGEKCSLPFSPSVEVPEVSPGSCPLLVRC
jgi:hypothetical protein